LSQDSALDDLQRFLLEHVVSYEELDVLLLLVRGGADDWSAKSVAEALGAATGDCRVALESLVARGLLATVGEPATFRYSPMTDETARRVELLERTYVEQRALVAMMMSSNALERVRTSAIRTFAEAFRLKGPKK
jgi:DNA-binding MarR family transcriptional regulator